MFDVIEVSERARYDDIIAQLPAFAQSDRVLVPAEPETDVLRAIPDVSRGHSVTVVILLWGCLLPDQGLQVVIGHRDYGKTVIGQLTGKIIGSG